MTPCNVIISITEDFVKLNPYAMIIYYNRTPGGVWYQKIYPDSSDQVQPNLHTWMCQQALLRYAVTGYIWQRDPNGLERRS